MSLKQEDDIKKGFLLNSGRYEIIKKIGDGGFGNVYQALDNVNEKKSCALKVLGRLVLDESIKKQEKEIQIMKNIKNEFIVKYIDHFIYKNRLCIVTELFDDGDLDEFINKRKIKKKKFDTFDILNMSRQILSGLNHLHKNNIIHLDIKPKNIFRQRNSLVVGDLGLAKNLNDLSNSSSNMVGTLKYMSPEMLQNKSGKCTSKSDIWSFGCVLYEMCELKRAFDHDAFFVLLKAIVDLDLPTVQESYLNNLLKRCFQRNPNERLSAEELINIINKSHEISESRKSYEKQENMAKISNNENIVHETDVEITETNNESNYVKEIDVNFGKLIKKLNGHTLSVRSLSFIENELFASGSSDKTIKLWDLNSGTQLYTLEGHKGSVFSLTYVNNEFLASASEDKTIKIWEINKNCSLIHTLNGHNDDIRVITYNPNEYLATGSDDGTIKIWDLNEGKTIKTLEGHGDWVRGLTYFENKYLVSGSEDMTIKVWDLREGKCIKTLKETQTRINAVVNLEKSLLASGGDKVIQLWDLRQYKLVNKMKENKNEVLSLIYAENNYLVSGDDEKSIKIWSIDGGKLLKSFNENDGDIHALAYLNNGYFVSGSAYPENAIKIWSLEKNI